MKCTIPGANVKVFGRAIHSLNKIGDELYIEALETGLTLRTVNSSRSAFISFIFTPVFFVSYKHKESLNNDSSLLKCKISLKSCLTVFKSLTSLEKAVEKCKISLLPDEDRLIFQLYCHHGIVKTHRLRFMECDSLQAVYCKELCPNVLTGQTRLISEAVMNFQHGQEEITLAATPVNLTLRNHIDDNEPDGGKVIRTELNLSPDEFDVYTIGVDAEITFCLKELRAVLFFSESSNLPVSVHFESPGKPVVFSVNGDVTFEANLVLATLAAETSTGSNSQISTTCRTVTSESCTQRMMDSTVNINNETTVCIQQQQQINGGRTPSLRCQTTTTTSQTTSAQPRSVTVRDVNSTESSQTSIGAKSQPVEDRSDERSSSSSGTVTAATSQKTLTNGQSQIVPNSSTSELTTVVSTGTNDKGQVSGTVTNSSKLFHRLFDSLGTDESSLREVLNQPGVGTSDTETTDDDEPGDDDNIPGTPPNKKFKSLFFAMSQSSAAASQQSQQRQTAPVVLAEDSNDED